MENINFPLLAAWSLCLGGTLERKAASQGGKEVMRNARTIKIAD